MKINFLFTISSSLGFAPTSFQRSWSQNKTWIWKIWQFNWNVLTFIFIIKHNFPWLVWHHINICNQVYNFYNHPTRFLACLIMITPYKNLTHLLCCFYHVHVCRWVGTFDTCVVNIFCFIFWMIFFVHWIWWCVNLWCRGVDWSLHCVSIHKFIHRFN